MLLTVLIPACASPSSVFRMMCSACELDKQGQYAALSYAFLYLGPVCCSVFSSNYCFLTCKQVSQEMGKVVWYIHLFENFSQYVVIHTVTGFSMVNEADINVFLEFLCFLYEPTNFGILISGSSAFSKSSLYTWKFLVHILLKLLEGF